jgi:hypothetical protein
LSERPIADAITFPVRVVAPDRPVDDVALEMLEAGMEEAGGELLVVRRPRHL